MITTNFEHGLDNTIHGMLEDYGPAEVLLSVCRFLRNQAETLNQEGNSGKAAEWDFAAKEVGDAMEFTENL